MHRYSRHSDNYPTPLHYQYRYFYPTPVTPHTKGTDGPRTHSCGSLDPDQGCHAWNKIGALGGNSETHGTYVRDHSLKKVLPWRANASKDVNSDNSFYTAKGLKYRSEADVFGTPMLYKFPDLVKASNVCASHANKTHLGQKFSPHEWSYSNQQLFAGAECAHNTMMMMGADAKNCIEETTKEQVRCASDTTKDLDTRLHDIRRWTEKEKQEVSYNISQTHELLELKEKLENMIKNLETPLNITQENIYARESRPGVELVHDAVEDSLMTEVETLRRTEARLTEQVERVNDQLTKLRAARHELEIDIRNKEEARNTDECVKILCQLSTTIGHIDIPQHQLAKSSPVSWLQNTQALIQRSQDERNSSQVLIGEVNRVILVSSDQCFNAWYETNTCFNSRIKEIMKAKDHLQQQHNKITHDIEILNRRMNDVKKALEEKKPALKLAQARAEKRTQRPGIELCHDKVTMALCKEINTLQVAIDKLASQLNDMETTMQQLMKTKGSLEKDLRLKDIALFVDRNKCLNLRQNFPVSTFKESRPSNCNNKPKK